MLRLREFFMKLVWVMRQLIYVSMTAFCFGETMPAVLIVRTVVIQGGDSKIERERFHKPFATNPRNLRLGFAIDGFNPFGHMSSTYSMWPVFLIPYNFPPWMCVDQSN